MSANIKIKPHLKAHRISPDEVILLGDEEQYVLRGAIYAALAPLLTGAYDADTIAERLASRFPLERVHYALMQLEAKGYATFDDGGGSAAETAWWSTRGIAAKQADALKARRVTIINAGAPDEAQRSVRSALARRFLLSQTIESDGFTVILCQDYLDPGLVGAITAALDAGCSVLPARVGGAKLWIGPLLAPDSLDLLQLLRRRLGSIRSPESVILARGGEFPLLQEQGVPESHAFAAAAIGSAVLATLLGQPPAAIREGVLTIDPWTLEQKAHALFVASRERLPAAPGIGAEMTPVSLSAGQLPQASDSGYRTASPEATLSRLQPLVSEITGIIPQLQRFPAPPGVHVYAASQLFGDAAAEIADHRQNRVLGQAVFAGGKGMTETQAKVSCLAEAIERYCSSFTGDEPRRRARIAALGDRAVQPESLLHFSAHQFAAREALNAERGSFNWVPMPFDAAREIDWTPGWSLTHERTMWLPSAYCYIRYPAEPDHDFCRSDSNGCSAGNTREEAMLQGVLELAERDACAMWWYNRLRRPGFDLASFNAPYLDEMQALYARHGRTLVALDLTNDLGIPTVMALSWQEADGRRIHVGLGTHPDGAFALQRAVTELNQSTWVEFLPEAERAVRESRNVDLQRWLAEASVASEPYVLPACGAQRTPADFPAPAPASIAGHLYGLIERFRSLGLDVIVIDNTRPDIGFPVMRVVVPGLRHFWARFGPGRLYDVPVALGWLDRAQKEETLNSKPFFI